MIKLQNIAIIAQGEMKKDLYLIIDEYSEQIKNLNITTTGKTGEWLKDNFSIKPNRIVKRGVFGGDIEIANMILNNEIDFVIFLIDPLEKYPHAVDASALIRVCIMENIPFALNNMSAKLIIKSIF